MIEAYAFLAAFAVQILAISVLYPAWIIRRTRMQATRISAERFAQLYPGADPSRNAGRFLSGYRALNTGVAVLGLLLLGWLFSHMRSPDWDANSAKALGTVYLMMQVFPLCLIAVLKGWDNRALRRSLSEGKRKAILQRRGLFDFLSPFTVFVAVLLYVLFVAFVIYIQQHRFPGEIASIKSIAGITLCYALLAFAVYTTLYGRKSPLETYAGRARTIGRTVRTTVYTCIFTVVFVSFVFTLRLLDLSRWEPFAVSVFAVISMFLCTVVMIGPSRPPEADGLGSGG